MYLVGLAVVGVVAFRPLRGALGPRRRAIESRLPRRPRRRRGRRHPGDDDAGGLGAGRRALGDAQAGPRLAEPRRLAVGHHRGHADPPGPDRRRDPDAAADGRPGRAGRSRPRRRRPWPSATPWTSTSSPASGRRSPSAAPSPSRSTRSRSGRPTTRGRPTGPGIGSRPGACALGSAWFLAGMVVMAGRVLWLGADPLAWSIGSVGHPVRDRLGPRRSCVGAWSHLIPALGPGDPAARAVRASGPRPRRDRPLRGAQRRRPAGLDRASPSTPRCFSGLGASAIGLALAGRRRARGHGRPWSPSPGRRLLRLSIDKRPATGYRPRHGRRRPPARRPGAQRLPHDRAAADGGGARGRPARPFRGRRPGRGGHGARPRCRAGDDLPDPRRDARAGPRRAPRPALRRACLRRLRAEPPPPRRVLGVRPLRGHRRRRAARRSSATSRGGPATASMPTASSCSGCARTARPRGAPDAAGRAGRLASRPSCRPSPAAGWPCARCATSG